MSKTKDTPITLAISHIETKLLTLSQEYARILHKNYQTKEDKDAMRLLNNHIRDLDVIADILTESTQHD